MKTFSLPGLLAAAVFFSSIGEVSASKVQTWNHAKPADYEKAKLKGAVISDAGTLRLSRKLKPLAALDAIHVWAVVEDRFGNLYVGTGDEGKVYRLTPAGKATLVWSGANSQVLSLAVDAKGETVFAGTGPAAQIVRIDTGDTGGGKVLCDLPASYVWALAFDPKSGSLYAATGPEGKVFRVAADGKSSLFYDTKQDHVLCIAVGSEGTVYAGTDKTGRVYRIDPRGKGFVLYQAPQSEVRTMCLAGDAVYIGTSATKRRTSATARTGESGQGAKTALIRTEANSKPAKSAAKGDEPIATKATSNTTHKEQTKGSATSAPVAPLAGENSVYRIGFDGSVREVFRDRVLVMSLLHHDKRLFVGTAMSGQLFEVNETTREKSEIARLDNGQILGLLRKKDGSVAVSAGDPGKLYLLEESYESKGVVTSEVLNAKLVSRWGALRWRGQTPSKTSISVAVRGGNVSEPDETWSDWSEEQTDGDESRVHAPSSRYLQYRVTLTSADPAASPALESLTIRYATMNQAPEVTKIEVPDVQAGNLENAKKLKLKWSATDANEDDLRFRLFVKKDGWQRWVELEDDWDKTEYEWDTTTTPSGVYRLKVVASDSVDNPEKEALTGERISDPFVVCHTAPSVTVKTAGLEEGRMAIEATATSPLVRLTAASFVVNGKKWVNVFPSNGLFDSKRETFKFQTETLKPGTYVLVLKVQDAAGNTGSSDVVFTVPVRRVTRK